MIHDCQFDYYARKLASCSSDKTIRIFDVVGDVYHPVSTIAAHEGPVWQVAWAHPKFGVLLASCSYDGSLLIHREAPQNVWTLIYTHKVHESSVNSISWAPHEYGLILACASSDGKVSLLEYRGDQWITNSFVNDSLGCNSVSWAPFTAFGNVTGDDKPSLRLVTGSCDTTVRVWKFDGIWENNQQGQWREEKKVGNPHSDWVRDVAWAPNTAMPYNIIASCGEDRIVAIWKQTEAQGPWTHTVVKVFETPVWRVSWSITGNVLAVSTGDHKVTLWKQSVDESWVQISQVDENTNVVNSQ